ncbi:hypothetical protein CTEN210_03401 [Chaetoceros tenuissimus]|uniref:Dynein heavy chain tail domain-containing protein n=1 Tax=Chaetoceros tenuissimus TaxID=426638 RepID=A0AAD3CIZ5_9STRA|nr:hypothetical protein CTEN210_03401 [Chaetoceros tenuissimus]
MEESPFTNWILDQAKALNVSCSIDELSEKHLDAVEKFQHDEVLTTLFLTKDENKSLILSNNLPDSTEGNLIYFIKSQGKLISFKNAKDEVIFGHIQTKDFTISSILEILQERLYPNFFEREWTRAARVELEGLFHRLLASLTESANDECNNLKMTLYIPEIATMDESGGFEKERIRQLETIAVHWIRQVKEVLTSHDHSIYSMEQQGVMQELHFWQTREECLEQLLSVLKSEQLLSILNVLQRSNSKYVQPVLNLTGALSSGKEEAAKSVKFLSMFKEPCEQLKSSNVSDISKLMPTFLHCIRLIHCHSTNYSSLESISDLLRRVSSEIIRRCAANVSLNDLFYGDVDKATKSLNDCIQCGNKWKEYYNTVVVNINRDKKMNGQDNSWQKDDPSIFAEVDAFLQRCQELLVVAENRIQFVLMLEDSSFANVDSNVGVSIAQIKSIFSFELDVLDKLEYPILSPRDSYEWHGKFNSFKSTISELELTLSSTINAALMEIEVVESFVHLLQIFEKVAFRDTIKDCLKKQQEKARQFLKRQCELVSREFDSNHEVLLDSTKSYGDLALWVNSLRKGLEFSYDSICSCSATQIGVQNDAIELAYRGIVQTLNSYQQQLFVDWTRSFESLDVEDSLGQSLLSKTISTSKGLQFKQISMNFNTDVSWLLSEASKFEQLHDTNYYTPTNILSVYHMKEELAMKREHIMGLVREYNDLLHELDSVPMQNLYHDDLCMLEKKLRPGFSNRLCWTTKVSIIEKFTGSLSAMIRSVHRKVRDYKSKGKQMDSLLRVIESTLLVEIEEGISFSGIELESFATAELQKSREFIVSSIEDMRGVLNELSDSQFSNVCEETTKEWDQQNEIFEERLLESLLSSCRLSFKKLLEAMKDRDGAMFEVKACIREGRLETFPSAIVVTNALNKTCKDVVEMFKTVAPLSGKKNKLMFYNEIVTDECLLELIQNIMNKMSVEAVTLREGLQKWDEFRLLWTRDISSHARKSEERNGKIHIEIEEYLALEESLASKSMVYKYTFIQINFEELKKELEDLLARSLNSLSSIIHRE